MAPVERGAKEKKRRIRRRLAKKGVCQEGKKSDDATLEDSNGVCRVGKRRPSKFRIPIKVVRSSYLGPCGIDTQGAYGQQGVNDPNTEEFPALASEDQIVRLNELKGHD